MHPTRMALTLLSSIGIGAFASAAETPTGVRAGLGEYEQELVSDALQTGAFQIHQDPNGKQIDRILIVPYDVMTQHDPWPLLLNAVHAKTQDDIVRQELLFQVGDLWSAEAIAENERNLRANLFVSVAEILPVVGDAPNSVTAVVVTKDLWSLRLNWNFSYVGSTLELLEMELTESNLLGRNLQFGTEVHMDLGSLALSQRFEHPRLGGSRVNLEERIGLILNRDTRKTEGAFGGIAVGQPLYSLATEWAWAVSAEFRRDIYRLFSAGALARVRAKSTGETLPYRFGRYRVDASAALTRSYGAGTKTNLSVGWKARVRDYSLAGSGVQAQTVEEVEDLILPRSERAGLLFATMHSYQAEFKHYLNLETLGLTEDVRLGPETSAELRIASRVFGFHSTYLEPRLSAKYTWELSGGLLTTETAFSIRYQPELSLATDWINRNASVGMRYITPELGSLLRLHTLVKTIRRFWDVERSFEVLGGSDGLRGYPSQYFTGSQLWAANLEARTRPFLLQTVHLGAAAFLDTGDAFDSPDNVSAHASVGLGIRALFPQFNRSVLRIDLATPLQGLAAGYEPSYIAAEFGQAF